MRPFLPALALALLAAPGFAQSVAPAVPAPAVPGAVVPAPALPSDAPAQASPPAVAAPAPARPRPRTTFAQRFAAANTTHDGRLTLDQARAARMVILVRNFETIDRDHKGYVTRADVTAFLKARRAQRQAAPVQQPQAR